MRLGIPEPQRENQFDEGRLYVELRRVLVRNGGEPRCWGEEAKKLMRPLVWMYCQASRGGMEHWVSRRGKHSRAKVLTLLALWRCV